MFKNSSVLLCMLCSIIFTSSAHANQKIQGWSFSEAYGSHTVLANYSYDFEKRKLVYSPMEYVYVPTGRNGTDLKVVKACSGHFNGNQSQLTFAATGGGDLVNAERRTLKVRGSSLIGSFPCMNKNWKVKFRGKYYSESKWNKILNNAK